MDIRMEHTETSFSVEMQEAIYNYIELEKGGNLSVKGFIKHLEDSYSYDDEKDA